MGTFYSSMTGLHYSSQKQKEEMEKKYMADLEKKKLKELQIANNIQHQNIFLQQQQQQEQERQARENARIIAEATKQAEKDRYNNELKIEKMRQEHDKKMRFYKLCDDFGIDYDDIYEFNFWLKFINKKTLQEYNDSIDKVKELVETDELKELYINNNKTNNKLQDIEYELQELNNISVPKVKNNGVKVSGTKKEIENLINENNKITPNIKKCLIWITIITLVMAFIVDIFSETILIIGGILDFIFFCRLISINTALKLLEEELIKTKDKEKTLLEEKKKYEEQLYKEATEIDKLTEFNLEQIKKEKKHKNLLVKYEKAIAYAQKEYTPNQEQFYIFRIKHYNKDFEVLLKKLELNLKNINKDKIINCGIKEDYINFIENAISNLKNDLQEYQEN